MTMSRRTVLHGLGLGLILSYAVGWILHYLHPPDIAVEHTPHHGGGTAPSAHTLSPLAHYLRDSTLAAPVVIGLVLITTVVVERILARRGMAADSGAAKLIFSGAVALAAAAAVSFSTNLPGVTLAATLRYTFALTLGLTLLFGVPWRRPTRTGELVS